MGKIVQKIMDKVTHEKESYRMAGEELKKIRQERPEMFRSSKKK